MKICMNQVNMTSVGGERIKAAPTPRMRGYTEGYFMQDHNQPKKSGFLKRMFKNITKLFK